MAKKKNTPSTPSGPPPATVPEKAAEQPKTQPKAPATPSVTISDSLARSEKDGIIYTQRVLAHLKKQGARFFYDDADDSYKILLGETLVPINYEHSNTQLTSIFHKCCQSTMWSGGVKASIERLMVHAAQQAGTMRLRKFSARSEIDGTLYVPIKDRTRLLMVGPTGIKYVPNGNNPDTFWIEHPTKQAFEYKEALPKAGLARFEELCVNTQASQLPSLRWLVAMAEGLFPLIREIAKARFILAHSGPSQSGKTSGAQRFVTLHGLGEVKGDCSIASLRVLGDCGLVCLDNRENRNFTHELVDHLLFLATGSESMRATREGILLRASSRRPIGVITTIEGVYTDELQRRIVMVEYQRPEGSILSRSVEEEIAKDRHVILSSLMLVLKEFMSVVKDKRIYGTCPVPGFEDHFWALCDLLVAYGSVSGLTHSWAEGVISNWLNQTATGAADNDNELEGPIMELISTYGNDWDAVRFEHLKQKGMLYITQADILRSLLLKLNPHGLAIPKTGSALAKRLYSNKFLGFSVIQDSMYPDLKELQKDYAGHRGRRLGLFLPSDYAVN